MPPPMQKSRTIRAPNKPAAERKAIDEGRGDRDRDLRLSRRPQNQKKIKPVKSSRSFLEAVPGGSAKTNSSLDLLKERCPAIQPGWSGPRAGPMRSGSSPVREAVVLDREQFVDYYFNL